jgi:hypothetical protein
MISTIATSCQFVSRVTVMQSVHVMRQIFDLNILRAYLYLSQNGSSYLKCILEPRVTLMV